MRGQAGLPVLAGVGTFPPEPGAAPGTYAANQMVTVTSVDVARVLEAAASGSPVDAVAAVARELGAVFDATDVSFLIADLSGRALVRLAHIPAAAGQLERDTPPDRRQRRDLEESATVLPFDGGPEEQAIRTQTVQVLAASQTQSPAQTRNDARDGARDDTRGWWRVLAPVTERGESIGLLELYLAEKPAKKTVADIAQLAHLLALVVIANQRHTDLFEWGQRTRSFSQSAEIQQRLLPGPRTCEADAFTVAGWLEPAANIGGDTFDYSLDRDVLHLSLTDAMGHGVGAALTASLCLGSLRGSRRGGAPLLDQAGGVNTALVEEATARGNEDFVTGLLARVDLHTGTCDIVNAGHVAPYLARGTRVAELDLPADLPFGLFPDTRYRSTPITLLPGDRLILVTDGMLEHNARLADLPGAIAQGRDLHPRELVRSLADSALDAADHHLSDDATILCLDWHGRHDEERPVVAGADPGRASAPLS